MIDPIFRKLVGRALDQLFAARASLALGNAGTALLNVQCARDALNYFETRMTSPVQTQRGYSADVIIDEPPFDTSGPNTAAAAAAMAPDDSSITIHTTPPAEEAAKKAPAPGEGASAGA